MALSDPTLGNNTPVLLRWWPDADARHGLASEAGAVVVIAGAGVGVGCEEVANGGVSSGGSSRGEVRGGGGVR